MNQETIASIKELVSLFEASSLTSLKVSEGKFSLHLEKEGAQAAAPATVPAVKDAAKKAEGALETITSPLVGTFYAAPSPDEPAFVTKGQHITEKDVVGLLESMKVFTEIPAGIAGTVEEILVKNGDFIEYDQPLFKIRRDEP